MRVARVHVSLAAVVLGFLLSGNVHAGEPDGPPAVTCEATADCFNVDPCVGVVCDTSQTSGFCVYSPKDCNDADACTTDTCDAAGCQHAFIECDDGNACT